MTNCDAIYAEFGRERTNIKRRELTTELRRPPMYLELYAALCLEDGPPKMATGEVEQ